MIFALGEYSYESNDDTPKYLQTDFNKNSEHIDYELNYELQTDKCMLIHVFEGNKDKTYWHSEGES